MTLPPLPRPPRWVTWLAGALWLALVILGAAVGGSDSFGARLARTLVDTAAPVSFAIAGGSALLGGWQRREWRRQTQFVAFNAFEEALTALAGVASELNSILAAAFRETDRNANLCITEAFRLPIADAQRSVWAEVMRPVCALADSLFDEDRRAHAQLTRHQKMAIERHMAAGDASLREADQMLAELRQDPELARLLPERDGPDRLWPADDLPGEEAAEDSSLLGPETVRSLLQGAQEYADSLVSTVDLMHTRTAEASAFADGKATPLVTCSLELRAAALALVAKPKQRGTEPDDETAEAWRYAQEASQARAIAHHGLVALSRCRQVLDELAGAFDDLRRDTRHQLPEVLREVQARGDLVDALIDHSVALRVHSERAHRRLRE